MAYEKGKLKKRIGRGDLTVAAAIAELRTEIIEEVKRVSGGYQQSIFSLVEKGKELIELEKMNAEKTPTKVATQSPKGKKGIAPVGIKAKPDTDDAHAEDF